MKLFARIRCYLGGHDFNEKWKFIISPYIYFVCKNCEKISKVPQ